MSYEYKDSEMYRNYKDKEKALTVEELHEIILNMKFEERDLYDNSISTNKIQDFAVNSAKIQEASIGTAHIQEASIGTALIQDLAVSRAKIMEAAIGSAQIDEAVINSAHIGEAQILNAHIKDAEIDMAKIRDLEVDTAQIKDASITSAKIQDAAILTAHIAEAAIDKAHIIDGAITNAKIANAAIENANIADAAIDSAKIKQGAIETAHLGEVTIGTTQIADGSITDAKIVDLTASKLTAGKIDAAEIEVVNLVAANITVGQINGQQIAEGAIDVEHILDGAITTVKIEDDAITHDKIVTNAVTTDKIAANAVTAGKIRANAIEAGHISSNAVTADKISSNAITTDKINANAVTSDKIVSDAITTRHVASKAITANEIDVSTINIGQANIINGSITTAKIGDAQVTNAKIANIHADKITAGVIDAERIRIGASSFFEDGYDPTKIEIGGRNLLLGTPSDWVEASGGKIVKDDSADIYRITNPSNGTWGYVRQGTFSVEPEESMTFRMYVVDYEGHIGIQFRRVGESGPSSYKSSTITKTGYVSQTYTNNTSETTKFNLWITVYGDTSGNNGQQFIEMRHYKLEKGNKATDWTPAPEDIDRSDLVDGWKYGNTTYIDGGSIYANSVTANQIASKTITANEIKAGAITATSGIIANAAITNAMIANATIQTAKIKDGAITNAKIGNLDAGKIKTGTLKAIDIEGVTITGSSFYAVDDADPTYPNRISIRSDSFLKEFTDDSKQHRINLDNNFSLEVFDFSGAWGSGAPLVGNVKLDPKQLILSERRTVGQWERFTANPRGLSFTSINPNYDFRINITNTQTEFELYGNTDLGIINANGTGRFGARNTNYFHMDTDRPQFYMYKPLNIRGNLAVTANRTITAGTGLSGGGNLGANRTLSVDSTVVRTTGSQTITGSKTFSSTIEAPALDTLTTNIYVRAAASGELRVTETGTTSNYIDLAAYNGYFFTINKRGGGDHFYIRGESAGEIRATVLDSTTSYIPIRARSFPTSTSIRENKENIELYDKDVLDTFRNANAYLYHLKDSEVYPIQKQLGVMVDETPRVIHGDAGDSVEMYAFNTYNFLGIKQLLKLVDKLYDRIELLEQGRD